jgi:hypothetical protein
MRRLGVTLIVLSACGGRPAPPPSAPVTVEVAPAAPITSGPLAHSPPPDPTPPSREAAPPPEDGPTTVLEPMPSGAGGQPFDRGAAASALGAAQIQRCLVPGGPTGHGHVTIVWDPSGGVSSATIDQGPFVGTVIGACLEHVYSTLTVRPFAGAPVRVGKSFLLQ